jgi:hypothetical protein
MFDNDTYNLEFDEFIGGHSGYNGKGKFGHCWWIPLSTVERCFELASEYTGKTYSGKYAKILAKINQLESKRKDKGYAF